MKDPAHCLSDYPRKVLALITCSAAGTKWELCRKRFLLDTRIDFYTLV